MCLWNNSKENANLLWKREWETINKGKDRVPTKENNTLVEAEPKLSSKDTKKVMHSQEIKIYWETEVVTKGKNSRYDTC